MNDTRTNKSALLLIDIQETFWDGSWGELSNPQVEQHVAHLLVYFREKGLPIIHIRHESQNPSSRFYVHGAGQAFRPVAQPLAGEVVFAKTVNSAFIGTGLEQFLRDEGIEHLYIAGLTLPHCVSTTTRMAANLGFEVSLVEDATASFTMVDHKGQTFSADAIQAANVAVLHEEFARIVQAASLSD